MRFELHLQKLDTIFGGAVFYVKILNEYFQQILNVKFLKRGGKISYPLNEEKEVQ